MPAHTLAVGAYVEICPPDNDDFRLARHRGYVRVGACTGGYEPLFKQVAALPGDVVAIRKSGMLVNGRQLANSRALAEDHRGLSLRPWPTGETVVPPGHVWLVSSRTPDSFDSRYFGPLALETIKGPIIPLWIMDGSDARP
jgi:conjugative transfer signal peptidase TraF